MEGTPARAAECEVPEPPWWIAAAVRGNSQSWGVSPMASTLPGSVFGSMPPQPVENSARRPASASISACNSRAPSKPAMLPKPM